MIKKLSAVSALLPIFWFGVFEKTIDSNIIRDAIVNSNRFPQESIYSLDQINNVQAATLAASIAEAQANHALSQAYYKKAIRLEKNNSVPYYLLGVSTLKHLELTRQFNSPLIADGINELREAIRLEPNNPIYMAGLSLSFLTFGNYKAAKEIAESALLIYPKYAIFEFYAGYAAKRMGLKDYAAHMLASSLTGKEFYMFIIRREAEYLERTRLIAKKELSEL